MGALMGMGFIPPALPHAGCPPLDHVLFALKHEGLIILQVLAEMMPHIADGDIGQALCTKPFRTTRPKPSRPCCVKRSMRNRAMKTT